MNQIWKIGIVVACLFIGVTAAILGSRMQLVFDYATLPLVPPAYELFAAPTPALWAIAGFVGVLLACFFVCVSIPASEHHTPTRWQWWGLGCLVIAALPLWLAVGRMLAFSIPAVAWWEWIWLSVFVGIGTRLAFWDAIGAPSVMERFLGMRGAWAILMLAATLCGIWWGLQSDHYYRSYQLGFNDFGHFAQRISNTAAGNGFLLETPVLPPFWDHFNPGLVLLVPAWVMFPDVRLVFVLQAACLAGSSLLVMVLGRLRGASPATSLVWGVCWLLLPVVGQMNLAYTYGWHPITLAIPCLLATLIAMVRRHIKTAALFALLAASFEEGVIVAIACFAAAQALRSAIAERQGTGDTAPCMGLRWPSWVCVSIASALLFVIVYRWSGLAEFQTGRFASLGNSAFEIACSPLLKPETFWGLLLRTRNLAFLSFLLMPLCVGATRTWCWGLLAMAPPTLVLMVWEHMPAQSIAFQYTSTLLPFWFFSMMEIARDAKPSSTFARSAGMLASVWLLAIGVGQMPWSNDSLVDVKAKCYGPNPRWTRLAGEEDSAAIDQWVAALRQTSPLQEPMGATLDASSSKPWSAQCILATGRIASHCVGIKDIETVGQFRQRYAGLQALDTHLASPILRYDEIVLDLQESFQQSAEDISWVRDEALRNGFVLQRQAYSIEWYRR